MKLLFFLSLGLLMALALASNDSSPLLQLASANDAFGLQLLHRLELSEKAAQQSQNRSAKNLFISPYSISSVLTMLMAGASNRTYQELRDTLALPTTLPETDIYTSYQSLLTQLSNLTNSPNSTNQLRIANSLALQNRFTLKPLFLNVIEANFASKLFSVDFARQPAEATGAINSWVSEKTAGKIPQLFTENLSTNTVMVLLNALYFKGTWETPIYRSRTFNGTFTLANNETVPVSMMSLIRRKFRYAQFEDGQMLEMPYIESNLSMIFYLPKENSNSSSLSSAFLGNSSLASRLAALDRTMLDRIQIPKFKLDSSYSLKASLQEMGITAAFSSPEADFSRISEGGSGLVLADVHHKTFLEVNEEGAEAAAATAVQVVTKSGGPRTNFKANRPFLFLIRDAASQLTLFAGVLNKP